MNITEDKINYLDNNPPKFKPNVYPEPYKKHIPKCYFIYAAVAPRGMGKTFSVVKLLKNMEASGYYDPVSGDKVKLRHYLFSPTAESNPIFSALKYLDKEDIINDYSDEKLLEIIEEIKAEQKLVKEYKKYVQCYKEYEKLTDEQVAKWTDYEALALLYQHNFIHYKKLDKPEQYVYSIILDDCLANKEAFSAKKANTLTKAVLNSRHIGINILICSQNLKSITKAIRNNVDIWCLFKCKNEKVLIDDLYPELSSLYTLDEFLNYYNYATSASDHDFLCYDAKEPDKKDRMKLNFDIILRH